MTALDGAPSQELIHVGIGASEAAAAVGLDPWTSPIELFERLIGESPQRPTADRLRWGKLLEHPIRTVYVEETGLAVDVPAFSLFHPFMRWQRATPDGIVLGPEVEPGQERARLWGLEVKTADAMARHLWGDPGTDQIPAQYICQVAWSMHVTGLDRWDVAVLFGGHDFQIYTVRRDRAFEAELVESVSEFWYEHVCRREPPPPDHTAAFRYYLERRFPDARDDYRPATPGEIELVEDIIERRRELCRLKRDDALDCNRLRAAIGDAAGLITPLGRVHWKPQRPRSMTDWKAIAEELAAALWAGSDDYVEAGLGQVRERHSRTEKPSRPLRLPRVKGVTESDEKSEES